MTRFLITGGAGFIGSHLAEALLAAGHEVLALDDLSTGAVENVLALKADPRFRLVVDTVFNEPHTAEIVDQADAIFHLAAAVGVFQIVESPVRTIENNIRGPEILLMHAAKKGKPTLIASTSEVYGKATKVPFGEEDDCVLGPTSKGRWSYAASKLVDEFLALSYFKEKKLPTVIARLFNTVGPRQTGRYGMVIPPLRPAGAGRRPDHGLRRREAVALLRLGGRRGGRAPQALARAARLRAGLQRGERPGDHDRGPRQAGPRPRPAGGAHRVRPV